MAVRSGDQKQQRRDEQVAQWQEAVEKGVAGEMCDRIVYMRPVPDNLLAALGRVALDPNADPPPRPRWEEMPLTERELEVLVCFGDGLETNAVAERLELAPTTVASHKRRVKAKLQAKNMAHAFAIAFRSGLID